MTASLAAVPPQRRKAIRCCAWGALFILLPTVPPQRFDALIRGNRLAPDSFSGHDLLWKETSWLR